MKCRLYPNKTVAEGFDKAIQAVHCYHNCVLYDIFNGNIESTAKPYKPKKESKPEQKKTEEQKKKKYAKIAAKKAKRKEKQKEARINEQAEAYRRALQSISTSNSAE